MGVFLQSGSRTLFYNGGTVCPGKAPQGPAQLDTVRPEWSALIFLCLFSAQETGFRDFPGGTLFGSLSSNPGRAGPIPGWGAKIPPASWPKKPKCRTEAVL